VDRSTEVPQGSMAGSRLSLFMPSEGHKRQRSVEEQAGSKGLAPEAPANEEVSYGSLPSRCFVVVVHHVLTVTPLVARAWA
jgi:hypothetical protein